MKNHLSNEKSPYLQQHAENPVDWYPWGELAIEKARKENKLIFLSIGYSTCHWCHVMEHESFEDPQVSQVLNDHFISIKVDREERPDLDALYMDAIQGMTGQGGWPMSVFLTPDLHPFFGGTYFPRPRFLYLLEQMKAKWQTDSDQFRQAGAQMFQWLKTHTELVERAPFDPKVFGKYIQSFEQAYDPVHGGKGHAPKFPPAYDLRLLLRLSLDSQTPLLDWVKHTLNQMAKGGIYDHLGGGFARYSTDEYWLVPHFEKMLYDQAALALTYLEAYQLTQDQEYKLVTNEILDYVVREMQAPQGGFYSAEDADSEGVEGEFYVWTKREIEEALGPNAQEFCQAFGVKNAGNFEGQNILNLQPGQNRAERSATLVASLGRLKEIRDRRIRPLRDEKVITAWNGLMISVLARASAVLGEPKWGDAAQRAADFILSHLRDLKHGCLHRRWAQGEVKEVGFLDDYAFFIDALLELHVLDSNPKWLKHAAELQETQDRLFWDPVGTAYFYSPPGDAFLLHRKKDFFDGVQPSGNSTSLWNGLRFALLMADSEANKKIAALLDALPKELGDYPSAFPALLMALLAYQQGLSEVKVKGRMNSPEFQNALQKARMSFLPHALIFACPSEQATSTYLICRDQACRAPEVDWDRTKTILLDPSIK